MNVETSSLPTVRPGVPLNVLRLSLNTDHIPFGPKCPKDT